MKTEGLPNDDYQFNVKAKDSVGNIDPTPDEKTFKISKKDNGGIPRFEMVTLLAAMAAVLWLKRRKADS